MKEKDYWKDRKFLNINVIIKTDKNVKVKS